jgi:hypothetical protein
MADIAIGSKIPTTFLPDDWRAVGAKEFTCSENTVERVVYGIAAKTSRNLQIFDFMLALALEGKYKAEEEEAERQKRLTDLTD